MAARITAATTRPTGLFAIRRRPVLRFPCTPPEPIRIERAQDYDAGRCPTIGGYPEADAGDHRGGALCALTGVCRHAIEGFHPWSGDGACRILPLPENSGGCYRTDRRASRG